MRRRSEKHPEIDHVLSGGQGDGLGTQPGREHMWGGGPGRRGA